MTSLIDRMAQASTKTRASYVVFLMGGERHVVACGAISPLVFEGSRSECLAYIERQCIRAAVEEARDATDQMLIAGSIASSDLVYSCSDEDENFRLEMRLGLYVPDARAGWRAMIDAMLAEDRG